MKDELPSKKDDKDSNNKKESSQNLTSSPTIPKNFLPLNDLSPDKNLNQKFFPSKENYFGVKASPTHGLGKTMSSGTHSPILNYYSNVSPDGKDYYYSPKEAYNQNSFNSKQSPSNFNFSPSTIFNNPKNSNQNSNNEEDSKTLQEKIEPLVNNMNNNNNFILRKGSFPSNGSNLQQNNNEDEEKEDDEEILTLSIDSGEEDYLLGSNKNIHFGGMEQDKKENIGKNNNNLQNKIGNDKDKNKLTGKENRDDNNNPIKQINTIYNNIQNSLDYNNQINSNIQNSNVINGLNRRKKAYPKNNNENPNINVNNKINNNINNNEFNYFILNNNQESNKQPEQNESLVENIINNQKFKPFIPNRFRNQFSEQNIPNYYYNNMNYVLKNNFIQETNFNNPYNQNENNPQMMNNMNNDNYINSMNNLNNNNYYPNNTNNIFQNPFFLNPNAQINMNNFNNYNNNYIPQIPLQINNNKNNTYLDHDINNNISNNHFYYKGDKYQINNSKEYKKKESGQIHSISEADLVTAITANNKVIKRIDPNTYLNESIEYLSYNILPLAKDQAGCRFLQEKLESDPKAPKAFYNAILPHIPNLVKDPFGNYLVQKICNYLDEESIKKIFEIISPNILDIGSNSHGTRVIQHLVNFLKNKDLVDYFLNILKPHVIPLLKELNGTHIINKFITEHPEYADEINKIIIENSSVLATHRHGCCILQRLLDGPDKKLKNDLIENLIENCFVLIIDQFGNYVIQSILLLNNTKASGAIALKICDNLQYYSKHRYSSNVIEKCFDHCAKKEKKILVQKICNPEMIADLILDEHGNYVVQKALFYADQKEKEYILNNIAMLIPKIRSTSFGEKMLNRLVLNYPILNSYLFENFNGNLHEYFQNLSLENKNYNNNNNYHQKNKKKKNKKKTKNNININNENKSNENLFFNNNNPFLNNSNNNFLNNNINVNNNITINNFNNINNNQMNLNQNKNQNRENPPINFMNFNNDYNSNMNYMQGNMNNINNNENDNNKKGKKKKKNKNKKYSHDSNNLKEENEQEDVSNNQKDN